MGPAVERSAGFVEADMAIGADTEDLQVDATFGFDQLIVLFAVKGVVYVLSTGHPSFLDVNMVEKLFSHEVVIRLLMIFIQIDIFV